MNIKRLILRLIEPHRSIRGEDKKRLSKLIISMTLLLLLLLFVTEVFLLILGIDVIKSYEFLILFITFILLIYFYFISKGKDFKKALIGILFLTITTTTLITGYVLEPEAYLIQFFFIFAIIIGKLVLNFKKQLLLLLLILSITTATPFVFPQISFYLNSRDILPFLFINGSAIILIEKFSQLQEKSRKKHLVKLNIELRDEKNKFEKIAKERAVLLKNIEELTKAKDDFFNILSHNLRTPLSRTRWTIELLQNNKKIPKENKKDIDSIYKNVLEINKIFNIMFKFSEERGSKTNELEKFSVKELIKSLEDKYANTVSKNVTITFDDKNDFTLLSSKNYILDILEEYLKNAINFTKKGKIAIKIELSKNKNGYVTISVKDTGDGILPKDKSKIFTSQYREGGTIDHARPNETKLGLGLAFVKVIADKSNIKVWFTSKKNIGSTFFLEAPIFKQK